MIDLPLGKALVAVLSPVKCGYECFGDDDFVCPQQADCCRGCFFSHGVGDEYASGVCGHLACDKINRGDGHKVIYRVVDYPVE